MDGKSFYEEGVFMCEPCNDRCVFGSSVADNPNDLENYDDPHTYRKDYYDKYKLKASAGDAFPACANGQVTQCYFPETGAGVVDNCMDAVFSPLYQEAGPTMQKLSPALVLRNQRVEQCPYFVCSTGSMMGGNGRMSFNASDCHCKKQM